MSAFDKAWDVVKRDRFSASEDFDADSDLWHGFDHNYDTCEGCGGQMHPHWPGYGPDGPENGNCDGELDDCDINLLWQQAVERDGSNVGHYWSDEWAKRWLVESRMKGEDPFDAGYGGEMIPCETCGSPYNQGGCEECQ